MATDNTDRRSVIRDTPERRRSGPRPHVPPRLALFLRDDPALADMRFRLRDLASLVGFSKAKIECDRKDGILKASRGSCSNVWMVKFADAREYLRQMGVI